MKPENHVPDNAGTALELRPWRVGDEASLSACADDRQVWANLRDLFPHPYTLEDARHWIGMQRELPPQTQFAIVIGGKAVGGIGLILQSDVYRCGAEIGFWLGQPYWGQGYMTRAVRQITEHGFRTFGLHRIYAHVFDTNPASGRVLAKAGYHLEGTLRRAAVKDQRVLDVQVYAQTHEPS